METNTYFTISGKIGTKRVDSRILEEQIQKAFARGERRFRIVAFGQHGIGGRLMKTDEPTHMIVEGHPGQRIGAMGFPNTRIELMGPASDDVGWLNAGAEITIHGNAGNGVANAMAQGKIYVAGNIGSRGMTMTKHNPRFAPPELWVLGSAGDYFGEFMAGGIAVICGIGAQDPGNVLGYRPLVGMVGGKVFFHGPHRGFSRTDAKLSPISGEVWDRFSENLRIFLERIERPELYPALADPKDWQLLTARSPGERAARGRRSMTSFRREVWDRELGKGGVIGDLTDLDRSPIPLIATGNLRRFVPVWENRKYQPPCQYACPTGIPVHERWSLIREGRTDEAVDLALAYTPFSATVCGYLCPNLCMSSCTRQGGLMPPVDITRLGKASLDARLPELPPESGKEIAVIGGGPAGISIAWQLRLAGHRAVIYDTAASLGGKIASAIPRSRLPDEVFSKELERIRKVIPHVHLKQRLDMEAVNGLLLDFDFVVIAAGAQLPRTLRIPGGERMTPALEFLAAAKIGEARTGERAVIIGAGNVGCDAAAEAHRLGAREITLIDVQEPASFGKERKAAEAVGAKFRWPCFTREITAEGVVLGTGETIPADTVIVSIGDAPDLSFLPADVQTERGFVVVDADYRTTHPKIFAVGDAVKPGLLTDAIGSGRKAAKAITDLLKGISGDRESAAVIDRRRIRLEYFDPRIIELRDTAECGSQCASCGACRDCGVCAAICPQTAIRKVETGTGAYTYEVDPDRCIGCGFCAGACPCGVWNLVENGPL